jgi:hypothetical protein
MLLWFAFGAIFAVWNVFQSSGLDFRLVAVGAVVPLVADLPFGSQAYAHTLLAAVVVLSVTMLATRGRGRRLTRRRALGFSIGWFAALLLSGSWLHEEVFWWPAFGTARPDAPLVHPWIAVAAEELLGLAAGWWVLRRFGLRDHDRRRAFLRTGRLAVVGEGR